MNLTPCQAWKELNRLIGQPFNASYHRDPSKPEGYALVISPALVVTPAVAEHITRNKAALVAYQWDKVRKECKE